VVGKSLPIRLRDPGQVISTAEAQRTHQYKGRPKTDAASSAPNTDAKRERPYDDFRGN
jgi:hypothetical protein